MSTPWVLYPSTNNGTYWKINDRGWIADMGVYDGTWLPDFGPTFLTTDLSMVTFVVMLPPPAPYTLLDDLAAGPVAPYDETAFPYKNQSSDYTAYALYWTGGSGQTATTEWNWDILNWLSNAPNQGGSLYELDENGQIANPETLKTDPGIPGAHLYVVVEMWDSDNAAQPAPTPEELLGWPEPEPEPTPEPISVEYVETFEYELPTAIDPTFVEAKLTTANLTFVTPSGTYDSHAVTSLTADQVWASGTIANVKQRYTPNETVGGGGRYDPNDNVDPPAENQSYWPADDGYPSDTLWPGDGSDPSTTGTAYPRANSYPRATAWPGTG